MIISAKNKRACALFYLLATLFATLVFYLNILGTASDLHFRTYRDGSEAMVLGKIFADIENVDTDGANLGFIAKDAFTRSPDVFAVYARLNHRDAVVPADLTDANWTRGMSNFDSAFLLARAAVATLGYAGNELVSGQPVTFANGDRRTVVKTVPSGQFVQVYYSGERLDGNVVGYPQLVDLRGDTGSPRYVFEPYKAQYGLQGKLYSWVFDAIGTGASVNFLQLLAAALFAATLALLCFEYTLSLSAAFGVALFVSMIGSPWIVSIVRNLYWTTFLWLLPALIALWIFRCGQRRNVRRLLFAAFFLSMFAKSLCGYEYLPTIVLFALMIFAVAPFTPNSGYSVSRSIRTGAVLFALSVAAFLGALLMQASIRAPSIAEGLLATYRIDAFKYSPVSGIAAPPMEQQQSLAEVLTTYIFHWPTPVLFAGAQPWIFPALIALAVVSLALQYLFRNPHRHRDFVLLGFTLLAPASWFVLMKRHSAIHTHLNYMLWYIGFIPALLFVLMRGLSLLWKRGRSQPDRLEE